VCYFEIECLAWRDRLQAAAMRLRERLTKVRAGEEDDRVVASALVGSVSTYARPDLAEPIPAGRRAKGRRRRRIVLSAPLPLPKRLPDASPARKGNRLLKAGDALRRP
jgi:hypothetical protein